MWNTRYILMQGISRSATILCAYLMIDLGLSAVEALTAIRHKREVYPNEGFLRQLCQLDDNLASRESSWWCPSRWKKAFPDLLHFLFSFSLGLFFWSHRKKCCIAFDIFSYPEILILILGCQTLLFIKRLRVWFLVACYATLYPTLSVCPSVCPSFRPSVHPSVHR